MRPKVVYNTAMTRAKFKKIIKQAYLLDKRVVNFPESAKVKAVKKA
jgi:hypothetical protein